MHTEKMLDFSLPEFMVVCGSVLLIVLLLTEILDWSQLFSSLESECSSPILSFGYAEHNGPHTWAKSYPESVGFNQSPINITTRLSCVVDPSDSLQWNGYHVAPLSTTMTNTDNTVMVSTSWGNCSKPNIQGGPLTCIYDFYAMVFHWGPSDNEGSEHTVDFIRYAMELQVVHVKRGFNSPLDAIVLGAKDGIVIASFFFQITQADNPYLDHIVTNLWRVARPGTKAHIPPFPLEWIFAPFEKRYFAYNGSFTQPPCSEIVTWLVQPDPIAISSNQVAEFRKIRSLEGPVLINCRPVQRLNERQVYFYE